jgi:hypothetical protein
MDDVVSIWFVYEIKPSIWNYKSKSKKKKVPFDISKEDFEDLIIGDCEYCHRTPAMGFGIDRVIPSLGYVLGNVVSCCFDCNLDKLEDEGDITKKRNERIAERVDAGELVIPKCSRMNLHKGTQSTSQKVCAYGKVYASKSKASSALGKSSNFVCECIRHKRHSDEIFVISNEFYEKYKGSEIYITKTMLNIRENIQLDELFNL